MFENCSAVFFARVGYCGTAAGTSSTCALSVNKAVPLGQSWLKSFASSLSPSSALNDAINLEIPSSSYGPGIRRMRPAGFLKRESSVGPQSTSTSQWVKVLPNFSFVLPAVCYLPIFVERYLLNNFARWWRRPRKSSAVLCSQSLYLHEGTNVVCSALVSCT